MLDTQQTTLAALPAAKNVFFVPCVIRKTQEAKVSEYFVPKTPKKSKYLKVSLYGHKLLGKHMQIPPNYSGYICSINRSSLTFLQECTFKDLSYFNHDKVPEDTDSIPQMLEYCEHMNCLHSY